MPGFWGLSRDLTAECYALLLYQVSIYSVLPCSTIKMYYYVILCITMCSYRMYYSVSLCTAMYYYVFLLYVLLCITMYCYVLLCITTVCITMYYYCTSMYYHSPPWYERRRKHRDRLNRSIGRFLIRGRRALYPKFQAQQAPGFLKFFCKPQSDWLSSCAFSKWSSYSSSIDTVLSPRT